MWFCRAIAVRIAPTLLRSVPMFVLAFLFFDLQAPVSAAAGVWFVITVAGSVIVGAALTVLLNISMLWTITGEGIYRITLAMVWIFSGIIIPLPLYPDWAQAIINILPFRDFIDIPFRLYIGNMPVQDAPLLLMHQLTWAVVLIIAGRSLMSAGKRKLVIQGG
jgi:ABC-2 type transport system permease protein